MNKSTTTAPPKGYKNTTIGIIPENWEVKKLGDLAINKNSSLSINKLEGNFGDYLLYGAGKIIQRIDFYEQKERYISIIKDGAGVGRVLKCLPFSSVVGTMAYVFPKQNTDFDYLFYTLQSISFDKYITGSTIPHVYFKDYSNEKLPIPPLPEQQKIAAILSTWDDAIANCKTTITTIKDRNKGLAQQLLTGKKRLGGFTDKWVELKADKIFRNNTDKTHNGELEILSATQERGVIPRSMNNIDIKYDANSLGTYKKVEVGDYVISLRSFQGGIEYSEYEGIVSPAYTILKEIIPISKTFFKVYFKTETFISRLNTIIYGIRDGKQISFKDFATLKLPCPSVDEQNAIAEVLEIAEQELKSYETKLEALQLQKKGLMQQLLTGKIRVNVK